MEHAVRELTISEIEPFLRYAQRLTVRTPSPFGTARAYDHRIFLCVGGSGSIQIETQSFQMSPGTMLMWAPGLAYSYHPENSMELIGFNFDYSQRAADLNIPIPPAKEGTFEPLQVTESVFFSDLAAFNMPVYLENLQEFSSRFYEIKEEYASQRLLSAKRCSALFTDLLIRIARLCLSMEPNTRRKGKAADIIAYLQAHFAEDITNELLGHEFGYHPAYVGRIVAAATGMTPYQYLLNFRIARAIDLLQSGEANVTQACYQCGFHDLANFSKCFKARTGRPPSAYLRS